MKTLLFVCIHNAGRSQMAEAFVNHLARERGLSVRAESAGTEGGASLNPAAVAVMAEVGISMDGQAPKLLTQSMADGADRLITMGCGVDAESCPAKVYFTDDWGLDDPKGQPLEKVRAIRDLIEEKVNVLLESLTPGPSLASTRCAGERGEF